LRICFSRKLILFETSQAFGPLLFPPGFEPRILFVAIHRLPMLCIILAMGDVISDSESTFSVLDRNTRAAEAVDPFSFYLVDGGAAPVIPR